jgi:septal ring factor EnvC (AmiA/AmiB activator)
VRSPGSGRVTFAGSVAGRLSVAVELRPGLVATLSYLGSTTVSAGDRVGSGDVVGTAGRAHDTDSVHLSVRVDGRYVDPAALLSCRMGHLPDALRLVE